MRRENFVAHLDGLGGTLVCRGTPVAHYWTRLQYTIVHHDLHKKGKWSRYTLWRRLGWERVQLLLILNLGTRWGWVVSITPRARFIPGERTHGTHWTGGWERPRAGLDAKATGKILCLCQGSNPGRPVRSQTLYWLSYPGSYDWHFPDILCYQRSETYLKPSIWDPSCFSVTESKRQSVNLSQILH
jgi:hypothetical protein